MSAAARHGIHISAEEAASFLDHPSNLKELTGQANEEGADLSDEALVADVNGGIQNDTSHGASLMRRPYR